MACKLDAMAAVLWMVCGLLRPSLAYGQAPTVIDVAAPEFGEAWLVWGIDGWCLPPAELQPTGTEPHRKLVRTPMARVGGRFRVALDLPPGTTLDFGVLFTRNRRGRAIEPFWYGYPSLRAGESLQLTESDGGFEAAAHRPPWQLLAMGTGMVLAVTAIGAAIGWAGHRGGTRAAAVLLLILVVVGLGLRLRAVMTWNILMPDTAARLVGDEPSYDATARSLWRGEGYHWAGRVPGYPVFLAAVYAVGGGSYIHVTYVQAVLGAAVIPLTFLVGHGLAGRAAGLFAAWLAAISPTLVGYAQRLMSEALYVPIVLVAVLSLMWAWRHGGWRRWVLAGVVLGVSNLIRPTLLGLPAIVAVGLMAGIGWRQGLQAGAVYLLAAGLTFTPWIVRNYVKYGAIFPLQTSNAILWQGSPEYYHLLRREHYTYMEIWSQVLYGPGWEAHDPTSIEGDRWWTQRALRSILSEPGTYLRYALEKSVTLWVGDPNADWGDTWVYNYTWLRRSMGSHWRAVQFMLLRMMPLVTLLSCVLLWRRWRACLPIWSVLLSLTLLHAATHAEIRLSDPFQPLQFALIAAAAVALAGRPPMRVPTDTIAASR